MRNFDEFTKIMLTFVTFFQVFADFADFPDIFPTFCDLLGKGCTAGLKLVNRYLLKAAETGENLLSGYKCLYVWR